MSSLVKGDPSFQNQYMDKSLLEELQTCSFSIRYSPLPGELDPTLIESLPCIGDAIVVPTDRHSSPLIFAQNLSSRYLTERGYLLIPGTRFDWHGTRHGRGGGWYDRFLAEVPKTWIRIGVAKREQISEEPLKRQPWDQAMDWLAYNEKDRWLFKRMPLR